MPPGTKRLIPLQTSGRPWTARETRLLGRFSDHEVARRRQRTVGEVRRQRDALSIPPLRAGAPFYVNPRNRPWSDEERRLLGKISDRELARRFGRSLLVVRAPRYKHGIPDPEPTTRGRPPRSRSPGASPARH